MSFFLRFPYGLQVIGVYEKVVGVRKEGGGPINGINTHQPKTKPIACRRGEGGGADVEWALMVARGWGGEHGPPSWEPGDLDAGDHQGNKCRTHPLPTALAPTDVDGLVLRLMRMRADQSAVGAINRPLL